MKRKRSEFFSLHDLLTMAALAALGGVSGAVVSIIRAAVHAVVVLPGGMQFLAGIHVLWLILAVGIVRRPGAATVTALLKGAVELLSGNPHGLLVLLYCLFSGLTVDLIWLLLGRSDRLITYALAGGFGAVSNLSVLLFMASIPTRGAVLAGAALLAGVAFLSGVVLAGVLGWWLLQALDRAGALGPRTSTRPT